MKGKKNKIISYVLIWTLVVTMLPLGGKKGKIVSADDGTIYQLKTENMTEPLAVDTRTPSFSWKLNMSGYGRGQSAYQIIVSTTKEKAADYSGDMWDSGKVAGENNYNIVYAGNALNSRTTYYWTVRVWDEKNVVTEWSDISYFHTGIYNSNDWKGYWIGAAMDTVSITPDGCRWIWYANSTNIGGVSAGVQYFRKTFSVNRQVKSAYVGFSADDKATLYVNGEEKGKVSSWSAGNYIDVTSSIRIGDNVVAMQAENTSSGYAGMISKIVINYTDGLTDTYVTDSSWKVSDYYYDSWNQTGYNDSGWRVPDQCDNAIYPCSPWGNMTFEDYSARTAPLLRKEFSTGKSVKSAYAYICGLGFFDMLINGNRPEESYLNPVNTQYSQSVLYRVFDVKSLLNQGGNAIAIELGNSFYNDNSGVWNWPDAAWRDNPKLMFELDIEYEDGTSEVIRSDNSWKVTLNGPTVSNGIYYGETYDARREKTGWDSAGYDENGWENAVYVTAPTGALKAENMEPVQKTTTYHPTEITKLSNGSYIITNPEMTAGWARLKINAPAGTQITITYGEKLESDGTVQKLGGGDGVNGNWWPAAYIMQDKYIAKGSGDEYYEPKFSYKGFQYIQVDGYVGELTPDKIETYRISNNLEITGNFESSNELINKLHKMMMTTMQNNFQGKPTDTPVWEKNGWLGDANVATETMAYNYGINQMFTYFIETMEDCLNEYGTVPNMVPTANWGVDNSVVWNSVFIFAVEQMYNTYGNKSYVAEQYDSMKRLMDLTVSRIQNNGWVWEDGQLADWVSPMGTNPDAPYNESPAEGSGICGTVFTYMELQTMVRCANLLGKTSDASTFQTYMNNIKEAFNAKFYDSTNQIYDTKYWNDGYAADRQKYRQTSNILPLAAGMVPDEYLNGVLKNLVQNIVDRGYHLDTGCVGTKFILPVLSKYGYSDVAYQILTQDTYPSWGYMITQGSTSLWEMWENTTRSLDHYFLGTYDEWLYKYIGGIQDMTDGYRTFTLAPTVGGELYYANTSVETVRGTIVSNWKLLNDKKIEFDMKIPVGATATIYLPVQNINQAMLNDSVVSANASGIESVSTEDGKVKIIAKSGEYKFICDISENMDTYFKNLALGATVTASSSHEDAYRGWGIAGINDGNIKNKSFEGEYTGYSSSDNVENNHTEWISMDLESNKTFNTVTLYGSTTDASQNNNCYSFPKDYYIEVSTDGQNWKTVYQKSNQEIPSFGPVNCSFDSVTARYIRLVATSLNPKPTEYNFYRLQLTEMKVYNTDIYNLAMDATVTASSTADSDEFGWNLNRINDGDLENVNKDGEYAGYSSNNLPDYDHNEWVVFDLGKNTFFDTVTLYGSKSPSSELCYGFPKNFTIQVSRDGVNYTTVVTENDYPIPAYGGVPFHFDAVCARYVKLDVTSLNPKVTDNNFYRLQLTEMMVTYSGEMSLTATLPDEKEPEENNSIEGGIEINGYQISAIVQGMRTVYSIENSIDGKDVVNVGMIYSLSDYATEQELYVGSPSRYVRSFQATSAGVSPYNFSDSVTATSYVMTMKFSSKTPDEYSARWRVRAYAQLSDGTYVYSEPEEYTIYDIADKLYQGVHMNNITAHNYLYTDILKIVQPDYIEKDYNCSNEIA